MTKRSEYLWRLVVGPGLLACATTCAQAEEMSVCTYLAQNVAQEQWSAPRPGTIPKTKSTFLSTAFIQQGIFDIEGDGVAEIVQPDIRYISANPLSYNELKLSSLPELPLGYSAYEKKMTESERDRDDGIARWARAWAWLPYGNRWYEVAFNDEGGSSLRGARYYDSTGIRHVACVFENEVRELRWLSNAPSPDSYAKGKRCAEAMANSPPPPPLTPRRSLTPEQEQRILARARDTRLPAGDVSLWRDQNADFTAWEIDFDNDGTSNLVTKIEVSSGAGRGYGAEYFAPVEQDDGSTLPESTGVFSEFQHAGSGNIYPGFPGALRLNWIVMDGEVYMERVRTGLLTRSLLHDVWQVKGDKVTPICGATISVAPTVVYEANP